MIIDSRDTDTRGFLSIPKLDEFKKHMGESSHLFTEEEILFDDIRDKANETILEMYDEIVQKSKEKATEIEELKQMFLLSPESIKEAKIKLNDTDEKILEKVYMADAKLIAKKDAEIKKRIDALISLNPNSKDFEQHFKIEIDELTMAIPLQNRTALTHYVARRKLVLELFEKILNKKLLVQENSKRNEDEKLLHNLIFQQKSDNPNNSDLWIMNEDFVYFNGTSESKLGDLSLGGIRVMKEEDKLTDEEKLYRDSLEENKYEKRPDILLFPNEGKCIIIELKNPNKNLSEHLLQINNYASLIRNLSKDEYKFDTFYGYLIGGQLDADQVQDKDSGFVKAYNFDYVFKPYYRVRGKFGRPDGSLYTEAITYHTLLERAKKRNDLFIKKLFNS
jgi:hypothetical protein